MSQIKKILLLLFAFCITTNTSFATSLEEGADLSRKYTLQRSPADAIQRLGAPALVIPEGDLSESFPTQIDLTRWLKKYPVRDQGPIGSCASHAGALTFMGRSAVIGAPVYAPSILSLYYFARSQTGVTEKDSGSTLYDVWKSLKDMGLPEERHWPYVPKKFKEAPPESAYTNAKTHRVLDDMGVCWVGSELKNIKASLANDFFVGFGMALRESFNSAEVTGRIPVPQEGENFIGNHAMTFTGFDDDFANLDGTSGALYVENSYGQFWGDKVGRGGRLYLPYSFFDRKRKEFRSGSPVFEAWTIYRVSGAPESAEAAFNYGLHLQPTDEIISQESDF